MKKINLFIIAGFFMSCSVAIRDTSFMAISDVDPSDSGYVSLQNLEYQTLKVERLAVFGPLIPIIPRKYFYSDSFKISKIDSCPIIEVENKVERFSGTKTGYKICVYGFIPNLDSRYLVHFKNYTDEIKFIKISSWWYCPFCTI